MIWIERSKEPAHLPATRDTQLKTVSGTKPKRTPGHTAAYQSVKRDLVTMQHQKCCYCERIVTPTHYDVEHYRPFSIYWWLAWTWENLLFSCAPCNRTGGKGDQFPLQAGCSALSYPTPPPGGEQPLLLDPCIDDPRRHIRFVRLPNGNWSPIGLDERGQATIRILLLATDEYVTDFTRHVNQRVATVVRDLREALVLRERAAFEAFWYRKCDELLAPDVAFRALSEDALRSEFPSYPDPPSPIAP